VMRPWTGEDAGTCLTSGEGERCVGSCGQNAGTMASGRNFRHDWVGHDYMLTVPREASWCCFIATPWVTQLELEALSVALARRTEALVLLGPNADAGGDLIRGMAAPRPEPPRHVYHDNVEPQCSTPCCGGATCWSGLVGGVLRGTVFRNARWSPGDRQKGRPLGGVASQCGNSTDPAYIGEHY